MAEEVAGGYVAVVGVVEAAGDEVDEARLDEEVLFELARGAEEVGHEDPLADEVLDQARIHQCHRICEEC